jgi:hypothetical protein
LDRGELRPVYLFDKVKTCKVEEAVIRRFDPEGLSFLNMNTPDDYQQALQRWNELNSSADETGAALVSCTVELFGMARLLAKTKTVAIALPQEATFSHLFSAPQEIAILVGRL